jgi:hypothetical protein
MYQDKLKNFKNLENLAGKAWEHAVAIDVLATTDITDCSIECFHYQQMMEMFFKHLLETKTKFGSYLWHWVIISFCYIYLGKKPDPSTLIIAIVVSLLRYDI